MDVRAAAAEGRRAVHAGVERATRFGPEAGVFALALAVRVVFVWLHPPGEHVYSDMSDYHEAARALLAGQPGPWDLLRPIGYPALLAALYALGFTPFLVGLLQALLGAACALWTVTIARAAGLGPWAAPACGAIVAVDLPAVYYSGFLLSEVPASFGLLLGLRLLRRSGPASLLGAGLAFGLAICVRPNLLLALVAVAGFLALRPGGSWRMRTYDVLVLGLGAALLIVPAAVHNSLRMGRPTSVAMNGGLNLFLNFSPLRGISYQGLSIVPVPNAIRHRRVWKVYVGPWNESYYYRLAFDAIRREPARLKVIGDNFVEAAGLGEQVYWPSVPEQRNPYQRLHARAFFFLCLVPAFGGWLRERLRRERGPPARMRLLLAWIVLGCVVTVALYLGDPRVRVPFDPLLWILAVYGWTLPFARLRAARAQKQSDDE